MHLETERADKLIAVEVTAGERHERSQAIQLLERRWADAVAGEKGCSASDIRNRLQTQEFKAMIPYHEDELGPHDYDRGLYRERLLAERALNRLKRYRRIATHYEKLVGNYLAMVTSPWF